MLLLFCSTLFRLSASVVPPHSTCSLAQLNSKVYVLLLPIPHIIFNDIINPKVYLLTFIIWFLQREGNWYHSLTYALTYSSTQTFCLPCSRHHVMKLCLIFRKITNQKAWPSDRFPPGSKKKKFYRFTYYV